MNYLLSLLIGVMLGSIPTAYLLLRKKNIDVTKAGSGNVGAMNSYEVTNSKLIGLIVFAIDSLKGLLSVWIAESLFGHKFEFMMIALIGAVLGHCYSFWINFKGGRGLATAAGGALLISIPVLGIWVALWLVAYLFRRHIHFANFTATLLTGLLSFTSGDILNKYASPSAADTMNFSILVSLMLLIILSKHIVPIKEYFTGLAKNKKGD
ncbi:acyl-phosphate glycerol 3-phosphate acyltransferase [Melioribacter roseus P3M-2]|uniref:Glycerol-3-phosphate acyltransferase n=1 Tax=Melioribacter roseus (strain DSM 23840 / JCM 17771 / VKM B-2668 / P3M-2) TaxID=1191523 RepID=I6YZE9_MELRP|nr:glycerol-3-phosphate acyltransferase [Melioribacter roseus]AFN75927.1 acyl-phosphate glycerol 3-phosphate acyltransferase [Melioribacter roseus P3M-2]